MSEARKVAVYAGTRNLYQKMVPALNSLLTNNQMDRVYFLIEDDEFPLVIPDVVQCINVRNQQYFKADSPNYDSKFTYMTLMRNVLSKILPDEDRVLYLDVDTIVDGDISDLFSMNMDGFCYAGVKEPGKCRDIFTYVNAGVLVCNLKYIRELGRDDEMIELLNRHKFQWPDQEVLNLICQGRIKPIGSEYNSNNFVEKCYMPKIIHYASVKDWTNEYEYRKYAKEI